MGPDRTTGDDARTEEESTVTENAGSGESTEETLPGDEAVMELLSERVPLSLLMDLSSPSGPDSEAILDEEGEPEQAWWEQS